MVIDSSAIVAILLGEADEPWLIDMISQAARKLISAATVLECAIVLESRRGESAGRDLDVFLHRGGIEIVSVTPEQIEIARACFRRYGKGRHPAGLNFGDCFSYSLAKLSGEPLLAKGQDFTLTDISMVKPK